MYEDVDMNEELLRMTKNEDRYQKVVAKSEDVDMDEELLRMEMLLRMRMPDPNHALQPTHLEFPSSLS